MPVTPKPPVNIPSDWQSNGFWCNLATLTNCAQSHVGENPVGGIGSVWEGQVYATSQAKETWDLTPLVGGTTRFVSRKVIYSISRIYYL